MARTMIGSRPSRKKAMFKVMTQGFLAAATIAFGLSNATAIDITGAGATFPYPIYSKWFDKYHEMHDKDKYIHL